MKKKGQTQDGKTVVGDVFKLFDSSGVPMDALLSAINDKGMVVDWVDFINEALLRGWTEKTLRQRLEHTIQDVYGKAHADEWQVMFDAYMTHCNELELLANEYGRRQK